VGEVVDDDVVVEFEDGINLNGKSVEIVVNLILGEESSVN
jgi:hypothetical protein